jgi:hypothetical protein
VESHPALESWLGVLRQSQVPVLITVASGSIRQHLDQVPKRIGSLVRHDMGTGKPVIMWSWVCSGMGTGLDFGT